MYTFRYALVSVLLIFFGLSKLEGQVSDIDFLIQYNPETCLYEACMVIGTGSATTYPQRIQFNAQYTIVVPTGTVLTIDTLFWPKENNATYTGTIPCLWEFGPKEIAPPTMPDCDYHAVFPNLSPPSAYDNLTAGDTVRLFGINVNAPLACEFKIRPFETGVDPPSIDMPSGGDYTCGTSIGSIAQIYRKNLLTTGPPLPEINWDIECNGDVTINVSAMDSLMCQHPYGYVWTGPSGYFSTDESPVIPGPVTPGIYEAFITDTYGCDTTIYIQVDGVPDVTADQTICGAGTVTLQDISGTGTGTWSLDPSNTVGASVGSTSFGTATAFFDAFATGTYVFIYSGAGCDAETEITVAASTTVPNVNNNGPLCVGDELILTTDFVFGATYSWTGPNFWTSSNQNPTISNVTVNEAGNYQVVVTEGGCPSSPSTTLVVIHDTPSTPNVSSNSPVCEGETINLSTDFVPSADYSWTGPNGFISSDQNPVITGATAANMGTYCVVVTVDGCDSNPDCTNLTVNPIPATPMPSNDGPVCEGQNINLSTAAVGGATYSWTGPNSFTSSSQNPVISGATPFDNGNYCVAITVNGCTSPISCTLVEVNPIPSTPSANNDGPVCEGENINLTTPTVSGASYAWSGPNGFTSTDQNPILFNISSSDVGTYCVIITVNNCPSLQGCSNVSLKPIPATPMPSNNGPLCTDDDLQLSTDFVFGATYAWSGPNGFNSTQQNPTITNVTNVNVGTYCVTVTLDGCDSPAGCTDAIINDTPTTPVVSSNSSLCEGETLLLDGPFIPGATYVWRDPNNIFFSAIEDPSILNITVAEAGTYCLVVTVNGCSSVAGCTDVIVNPIPPTPIITSNSPICPGDDILLFTDAVPGATYTWTGPSAIVSNDQNAIYSGASAIAGTYCLVVSANGCDSEQVCADISIKTTPSAPNISSNTPRCEGNELLLTADPVAGATYEWTGPDGFISNDQNPTITNITTANAGTYSLTVIVDGCESPLISTNVDIFPTPTEPTPVGNGPICEGEDILLAVDAVSGANYIWSGPNSFTSFSQNPTITGATSVNDGTYCVIISLNGCDSTPGCVDVTVKPIPATPIASNDGPVCDGEDINLTTAAVTGATYSWTGPNGFTSSDQNPVLTGVTSAEVGSYCVVVIVDGCASEEGCTDIALKPTPATPVASNDGPVCDGEDINLTTAAVTGATYSWTGPNGFTSSDQNPVLTGVTSAEVGSYCVVVIVDGCASEEGCTDIALKPTPATPVASNDSPVCDGEDINLTTAAVTGATYSWTGPNGFTSSDQNPVLTGVTSVEVGSYCVVVIVDGCASEEGCTDIALKPTPATPVASNDGPVCDGEDINLTTVAVTGATYSWTGPNGFTSSDQNPVLTGVTSAEVGSYCVVVIVDGCASEEGCTDIALKPTPATPVASNDSPVCDGEDINLTTAAVTGATYSWTGPNGFTSSDQNPVLTGVTSAEVGSYCVVVIVDGCASEEGCTDIALKPTPATPVASNDGPVCDGEDINLTTAAVTGATYSWTGPNGFTSSDQNPVLTGVTSAEVGSYCVVVIVDGCASEEGCTDVALKPTPAAPVASNDGPVCDGEDINLTTAAVTGATYSWTGPNGFTSSDQNPVLTGVTSAEVGSYCVVVIVDGCASEEGCTDVALKPIPATPVASNDGPVCDGEDINLTTAAVTGATYSWTGPNGFTSSDQNPVLTGVTSAEVGSYCVVVIVDGCASEEGCTDVALKPTPATPVASNDGPVCDGEDINLTTVAVTGATYSWTGPNGFTSSDQNPVLTGVTSAEVGSYCVVVIVDGCASEEGCTDVALKPTPATPVASNDGPVCDGEDINLTTAAVTGATYSWTGPNGFTSSDQNPVLTGVTSAEVGSYCVVVIVDGCASEEGCTDVALKPTPAAPVASNDGPVCDGEDINLTTAAVTGATYSWTGPNGFTSSDQNPVLTGVTSAEVGSYCVVVIVDGCASEEGCTDVALKPTPAAPVASNDGPVCDGEDINLSTAAVTGATYSWTGPNGFTSSDQNPVLTGVTLAEVGSYCVVVIVDGCSSEEGCTDVALKPIPATPVASNDGPVCDGEDINLTTAAITGATYSWTGPNGFISSDQNPVLTDVTSAEVGSYCVVVIVDGCSSEEGCTDVALKPTPVTPVASNDGPVCDGEDINLTTVAVTGATYSWTGPNGFTSSDQNPVLTGVTSAEVGSYCVVVTVDGCASEEGCTLVEVKSTPTTPIASNNGPICEDEDLQLFADNITGATYSWSGPNGFTSSDQNPILSNALPSASGTYCVFVIVDGCVSEEGCTLVEVKPTPTTPIASNNGPICEDEDLQLFADNITGATYSWSGPNGFTSSDQNPILSNALQSASGTYCVFVIVDGCVSEEGCTNVEVKPTPTTPIASNNGPICEDEDLQLFADNITGATYSWSGPNGFTSSDQNPILSNALQSASGTYCVFVIVDGCVSEEGCTNVEVKPTPTTPIASNNGPICEDEDLQLFADNITGATYSWSGPNGFTSSDQNPVLTGVTSAEVGSYCVVVIVDGCSSEEGCTDVGVKPTPTTPVASNNGPICEDEDLLLFADNISGATYSWSGPNGFTSSDQNPIVSNATQFASGTYCVFVIVDGCVGEEGCTNVEVKPTPTTPVASNSGPICEDEDLLLFADNISGATYSWSGPNGFTSSDQNPIVSNATQFASGTYCVFVIVDGCVGEEGCTNVEVKPTPTTPVASNSGPICEDEDLLLFADNISGATYSWSGPNGFTSSDQNPIVSNATQFASGTYCVFVIVDGCVGEEGCTNVEVKPTPTTPVASNSGPICEDEDLLLFADNISGATYSWSGPNGFTSSDQNPILSNALPSASGTYCVFVIVDGCVSEEGCTNVEVKPTPATPLASNNGPICEDEDLLLFAENITGATYSWSGPNGFTSSDQNPIISNALPSASGTYCVFVIVDGCISEEGCTNVEVKPTPTTPVASNNGPICEDEDLLLFADNITGATYSWSGPNGFTSSDQNPIISNALPSASGTYCVFVIVDGCVSEEGCINVEVKPTPSTPIASNNTPICEDDQLQLITNTITGATYSWSGPNGFTSNEQNPIISNATMLANGTYCVYVTVNGCESEEGCTAVEVKPTPSTPIASNNAPICENENLQLSAITISGATYSWTGPNGFTSNEQNPSIPNATLLASGTYCVFAIVNGCESDEICTLVEIKPNPITPAASNNGPICEDEDLLLFADNITGATYSWSGPNGFTSSDQNPIISNALPSASGTYCVFVMVNGCVSGQGCTDVEVKPTPSTPIVSNNGPICEDEDLLLFADNTSGATYSWSGPNGFTSSDQNPIISNALPSASGTYCVFVIVDGCISEEGCTNVEVKPTPTTPVASNNGPICEDEDLLLFADNITGATYSWSGPNGFTSSDQNPIISNALPSASGTYCVFVIVDGCVSEEGCINVEVKPTPSTPIASNNTPICEDDQLQLTTNTITGATYSWSGPNGFTSNEQNPIISNATMLANGTYCVYVTVNGCESEEGCTAVEVKPTPSTPIASNNAPICENENLQLSAIAISGATYSWTGPNGFTSNEQNPSIPNATLLASGTYCVFAIVNGCESDEICTIVEIKPNPITPAASNNGPICEDEDLLLFADNITGATYSWSGPNGFTSSDQNPIISNALPSASGTYCVFVMVNGCVSGQGCTDVEVKPTPSSPIVSNNGPICEGENINLTTDAISGATYSWTGPNGFTSTAQNPIIAGAVPGESGPYCVVITVNGCLSAEACTEVEVKPTPAAPLASNNGPICEGENINLTTDAVSGATYSWTGPNGFSSSDQNPIINGASLLESGSYCLIIAVNGCLSAEVCTEVEVKPTPATPVANNNGPICEGENIILSTDAVIGATYAWNGPNGFTSSDQNPVITGATSTESGSYCVVVTVNGCISEEGCTNVEVKPTPPTPIVSNNGPICEGENLLLNANTIPGATYSWSGPNGFTSSDQNPEIIGATPSENGSYCLIIIIDGCESISACTDVEIKDKPSTPVASNNGPICENSNLELFATTIPDAIYSWTGPNSFVSNVQNPIITGATPLDNGSYCVTVTVNGCDSEESCTIIEVKPTPEDPTPSNNGPICEGENIELTAGDVIGATYSWTGPNSFVSNIQNPIINGASVSDSGLYCVVITIDGCISSSECTAVIVKSKPTTPIVNNNGPICEGENLELSSQTVVGASYSWTGPNSFVSSDQNPIILEATPLENGTYCLVVTIDGCASEEACTEVEISPEITAGEDQSFLCAVLTEVEITMAASATSNGSWSTGSNPASVSFSDINSPTTTITNVTIKGTYTFIWSNGICADTVEIEISKKPNAGVDQFVKCNEIGSAIMAAQGVNGTWSLGTVDGSVDIIDLSNPNTAVTNFENPGFYELIWTIDGCSDMVVIEVDDDCVCPIANNTIDGNTEEYCGTSVARFIEGEEATPLGGVYQWQYSQNSGPFVDIATTNSKDYTTPVLGLGTHEYRRIYTVTSPVCSDTSNQVLINVLDQPLAGDDQTLTCQDLSNLEITMNGTGTGNWNLVSGDGSATIVSNNSPNTIIREFTEAGTYIFSFGNDVCFDEVEITITEAAYAGPDQNVECFATDNAVMAAVANSNGSWSWGSTPGDQPVFDMSDENAVISGFGSNGNYELIWTVGSCSDSVIITVGQECDCPIEFNDIIQANPAQFCGESGIIELIGIGAAPDGEYTWEYSFDNGPWANAININNQQNYTTENLLVGNHRFRRTYETTTAPICIDISNVIEINVIDQPDAGEDQALTCIDLPGGSIVMNGSAIGTWSALNTNFGSANIVDDNSSNTEINGFTEPGNYGFVLTNAICKDTVFVEVTESVDAGADQTVDCYVTGSATMSAVTGNGTWSVGFIPATANEPNIVSPGSPNSTINGFDLPGTYQLIWTNITTNCSDEVLIEVGEDCACPISGNNLIQPIPSEYCDLSPMILIAGSDATPADGSYLWEYDNGTFTAASGANNQRDYTTLPLTVGQHRFRRIYTIETPMCSDTSNVIIINVIETPNAGIDQFLECITLPGSTVMAASGTGVWTANSGNPSTVTFIDNGSATTPIVDFTAVGEYFFTYANGICTDEVKVTVSAAANAGSDQSVNCFLTGTASLSATGSGTWSYGNTTGGDQPSFTMTNANTTISGFAALGTYELIWTSNGCMDTIWITVGDDCSCPIGNNLITQPDPEEFCDESDDVTIIGSIASPTGGAYIWEYSNDGTNYGLASGTTDQPNYSTGILGVGEHFFRRLYDLESPDCSDTSNVVSIVVFSQPNAGVDQTFNCVEVPMSINMAGTGPGVWTANTGNPSSVTITTPTSATTEITGLGSGDYFFTFTNSICSDEVMISITAESNAGVDQSFDCYETATAVMNASGNGTWSWGVTPNNDEPTFSSSNPNTSITGFLFEGDYELIWTNDDGCSDSVVITVGAICDCPIANNIIDQPDPNEFCELSTQLNISGTDATPADGTYTWQYSSDGVVYANATFGIINQRDYTTDVLPVGIHRFRRIYTVTDPIACEDISNFVSIEVFEGVEAGPDQSLDCYEDGVATMAANGTGSWSWVSGDVANINGATNPNATIDNFPQAGTYELMWTSDNGGCTDNVSIVVGENCVCPIENNTIIQPDPSEFCGVSELVTILGSDALPAGGTYSWEHDNGSGFMPANGIKNDKDYTTEALTVGVHRFRRIYTVTDPIACEDISNVVTIIVHENAEAGPDQSLDCYEDGVATMSASGSGSWTWVSGDVANINGATNPNATIDNFPQAGTYELMWTSDDGGCTDNVSIVVGENCVCPIENNTIIQPDPSEFCGVSELVTILGSDALPAGGTYSWEHDNGSGFMPANGIKNDKDYTTEALTVGVHRFRRIYTVTDPIACEDISNVVTIIVHENAEAGPDQSLDCYEDGVATMAANGTGSWSWVSGDVANINGATNPNATIDNFPQAGTYELMWTSDNGGCTDNVSIVVGENCVCPIENNTIIQPDPSEFCGVSELVTILGSDALPAGGTYSWEHDNGSGFMPANGIKNDKDYTTEALSVGVHRFRRIYTVTDPIACEDISNVVTIIVHENAKAGPDQSLDCYEDGVATMAANGTGSWSWVSGDVANINGATNPNATIDNFPQAGTYELMWTTDDGGCTDNVSIVVGENCVCPIENNTIIQPDPSEFCGVSELVTILGSDALPAGGTYSWEHDNGSGFMPANGIKNDKDYTTEALTVGVHRFRRVYTVTDPIACEDISNVVTIIVHENAEAGPDQSLDCYEDGVATMAANGTGSWSWVSGDVANINGATNPNATIDNFPQAGTYELMWTSDNGGCTDNVSIVVGENCVCPIENNTIIQPDPSEFCGVSELVTILGSDALPAGGTYSWEHDNGSGFMPANGIKNDKDYTTEALSVGVHRFRRIYTVTDPIACEDISNVVTIIVHENAEAGPDQSLDCYEDGVATMAANGTGSWSWVSGDVANINGATNPNATIDNFPQAGTYELMWTTDDGGCTDNVSIVVGENCVCPIENNTIIQPDPSEFCGVSELVTILGSDALPAGGTYSWEHDNGSGFMPANGIKNDKDYTTEALTVGVHRFRRVYTVTDPIACEDISNVVTIIVHENAEAGPDQSLDCYEDGVATMAANGTGSWSWVSGDVANINGATNPNATIDNFPQAGTYELMWTSDNGGCTDNVSIVVGENCVCPIENNTIIQPDPSEFCGVSELVTILGSDALPAGGTYSWEHDNGSGFMPANGIKNDKDYTTEALTVGVHRFRRVYTVTDPIACEDISNVVTIIVHENAEAGPDQSLDCYEDGVATMAANGTGSWSWVSGDVANINGATNPNATIDNFPQAGTYELMWTSDDGGCTDVLQIIVGENCVCPIENNTIIQPDPSEFCGVSELVTILGSDALPAGGTYSWEHDNGSGFMPANGIKNDKDYTTEALSVGVHRFRRVYTVTDPIVCEDISNVVTIIVHENAEAGPDQSLDCYEDGVATMSASGSGSWTWVSGDVANINGATNPNATIDNFPQAGTYELMWTSDDGICSDIVQIVVGEDCFECEIMNNDIFQPIPSEYCEMSPSMTIVGGAALPVSGQYTWEYSFNGSPFVPATGTISQPNYDTSNLGPGVHRFRRRYLLQTNPICEDVSDIVFIEVIEPIEAGENQDLGCILLDGVLVNMTANGEGTWIQSSSNPSQIIFSDISEAKATLSGFDAPGVYTFTWTNGTCEDDMSVYLEETKNAGEDQFVACFVDGVANLNAEGFGTWSIGSNNPGTVEFSSLTDPKAVLTNFSIDGLYEFIWSVNGCDDSVFVQVGDACPCIIETNNLNDDISDVFCKSTGELMIVGNEATPFGGDYLWQISINGSGFSNAPGLNNTKDYDASNYNEGTYILRRQYTLNIDGVECVDISEEIEFYVFDKKQDPGEIVFTPNPVCLGDSLILEVEFNPELTYNWQIMSGGGRVLYSLDSMSMIIVESPGTITVSVTQSLEGCDNNLESVSSEIEITVLDAPRPNLGQDTTFCELDETYIIYPGDFAEYEWHDGSTDSEYEVDGEGIYSISVTDTMGCVGTDMVNIKSFCCEFAYPNIFRADSRGENSEFKVTDIYGCVLEAELFVYDRWGNLVFIGDGLESWDGTFNGKFVEQGVYVFIYKYKAMDADRAEFEDEVSGDVTVLR